MKKKIMVILIVFLIFVELFGFINFSEATKATESDARKAMEGLKTPGTPQNANKFKSIINTAIGFIQITGTGISVIMVTVLGIRYLLASPSEKADVKKHIAPLVIGAVVLFASVNIIQTVADIAETLPDK